MKTLGFGFAAFVVVIIAQIVWYWQDQKIRKLQRERDQYAERWRHDIDLRLTELDGKLRTEQGRATIAAGVAQKLEREVRPLVTLQAEVASLRREVAQPRDVKHTHALDVSEGHVAVVRGLLELFAAGPDGEMPGRSDPGPSDEELMERQSRELAVQVGAEQILAVAHDAGAPITPQQAIEYARHMLATGQPPDFMLTPAAHDPHAPVEPT